jgi:exonuclease VII large subunit
LSPLSTLERGYCIARKKSDLKTINDHNQVEIGDSLELILHRGELGVKVEEKKEKNIWEQNEPDPSKNQE